MLTAVMGFLGQHVWISIQVTQKNTCMTEKQIFPGASELKM